MTSVVSARNQAEIEAVAEEVQKRGVKAIEVGSVLTDALKGLMTLELESAMLERTPMGCLG